MRFAKVKKTCLGCKAPLPEVPAARAKGDCGATYDDLFDISQQEAKKWLPPDTTYAVWRARTGRAGWCGHAPPMPRVSCTFGDGATTCKAALREVLVRLWETYLDRTGQTWEACPHEF
jgi:hypothetical protein